MIYEHDYYVNGFGFNTYAEAKRYADYLLEWNRIYKCVFTKAEMNSMSEKNAKDLTYFKDHFNES